MNYMAEVAKMLGVNICEEFEIKGYPSRYMFINDGIIDAESGFLCKATLWKLLTNQACIKRKPWKPENNDMFFVVLYDGSVATKYWDDESTIHRTYYKIGNCYRHFNEAKDYLDKWMAFYASDEVLEV